MLGTRRSRCLLALVLATTTTHALVLPSPSTAKPQPSVRGRKAKSAEPWIPEDRAERLNAQIGLCPTTSAVIIDGNNVRGCAPPRDSIGSPDATATGARRLHRGERQP